MGSFSEDESVRCESKEERNRLLRLLESCGYKIFADTLSEMDDPEDFDKFPTIVWSNYDGGMFTVSRHHGTMSIDVFKSRLTKPNTWGNSSLKFSFI